MKSYILIAGVNGAGKSTLYQILDSLKKMPRVNTDEIVRSFGNWKNPDADVERRYSESLRRLKNVLELCDMSILYDNTRSLTRFAIYQDGILCDLAEKQPEWYKEWK